MPLGEKTAINVDRNPAFLVCRFFPDKLFAFAHGRKAKTFISHNLSNGKAVMYFSNLYVFRCEACHFVSLFRCPVTHTEPLCKIGSRRHINRLGCGTYAEDPDRFL